MSFKRGGRWSIIHGVGESIRELLCGGGKVSHGRDFPFRDFTILKFH